MTSAKQVYLGSRRGPALPYDAEVEYIESTGTQWIDTGIKPSADIGIYADAEITHAPYDLGGFTGCTGTGYFAGGGSFSQYISRFSSGNITVYTYAFDSYRSVTVTFSGRNVHKLNWLNDRRCVVDGYLDHALASPSSFQPYNITVMHLNVADNANNNMFYVYGKLYGFKVSSGANIIMDLVPVRITNEQGVSEGAMYDRVSGQLFRNAGKGAFTVGPDKTANLNGGGGCKCLTYLQQSLLRHVRVRTAGLWKEAA